MSEFEITAEARDRKGKGASRRLRRAGYVPAILYGAGKNPVQLQLKHNDVVKRTELEAFYSHILTLNMPDGAESVVLKDMQRHPYKSQIMHMDFLRINENEQLTMRVPLHFINEDVCVGVRTGGGVISHLITELEIVCLPRNLPEYIEIDVAELDLGATLHLSDILVPEGVEIAALIQGGDPAQTVVSVQIPRAIIEPEEVEAEEEEGELIEGAEPGEEGSEPEAEADDGDS
ncbi:MAG: 50S ribosomal protein L25/general stress protein Ctc [Gammaproteobacteria bacterium]|jgi:large subunit ribosomal protein L25|nr:50S ribosomal protein L25/general stress protein Ctc [Gammaproteobacteria bacterium]HJP36190.1 50S ribosomal protein L25/general stress protein Ctc [Gammaproteobacteria bacterium]